MFAFRAESKNPEGNAELSNASAWKAWTDRRWKLPRIGQPNPVGAWLALERSVTGLAWLGKKQEAAALRPFTDELVLTGVWASWNLDGLCNTLLTSLGPSGFLDPQDNVVLLSHRKTRERRLQIHLPKR